MKHPNKKIESTKKWQAKYNLKSCFNFWLDKPKKLGLVKLTENTLLNAIVDMRRGGKTIKVELKDL